MRDTPNQGQDNELNQLAKMLEAVEKDLKPGGPPVDESIIKNFVEGKLDQHGRELVAGRIVEWQSWWNFEKEYRRTRLAKLMGEENQET